MDNKNYYADYERITKDFSPPSYEYISPEEQGKSIEVYTLLEHTNLQYSNETKLLIDPKN